MPRSDEFAEVLLDVSAGAQPLVAEPTDETPFRILVAGDFSGRDGREQARGRLKPVPIDRDNFDEVLAGLGVRLRLGREGDEGATLHFRELDDFHPDRIYRSLDIFRELRAMRESLEDASSGSEAIAKVRDWAGLSGEKAAPLAQPSASAPEGTYALPLTGAGLLDDILEASEPEAPSRATPPRDPLQAFIQRALAPHLAPQADPQVPELLARLDEAAGTLMRAILHGKQFQALEAAWRGLFRMIRRLETGTLLKVYLLDLTREELAADLPAGALETSALYRLLVDEAAKDPDHGGWAVLAGHYSFDQSGRDTGLLRRLGQLARAAGAVFLAEGDLGGGPEATADATEAAGPWGALRHSAEASSLGLALPRYLLRLPYGRKTDEVESFRFEEMVGTPAHGDYLWGNPALACATLLGEAFSEDGWQMRPGVARELGDMPLHVYEADGEQQLRPCVELALTPPDAEWALGEGYMPLIWLRGHDSIRLVRFQSIADPAAPLAGRWG